MASDGIPIDLDRPRRVKFTFSELRKLQGQLGKPLGTIFTDITALDINVIMATLWRGLLHEDKKLRFDDLEGILSRYFEEEGKGIGDIVYVLNEAIVASGFFGREPEKEMNRN